MINRLSIKAFKEPSAERAAVQEQSRAGSATVASATNAVDLSQVNLDAATMERFFSLVSPVQASRVKLEAFVGFLQDHGILPHALRFSFDQQARLQKCAFIAQVGFGLDLGYDYHVHEYGAFSSFVGADFVQIVRRGAATRGAPMPAPFQAKRFVEAVAGREIGWLCVATVAIHEMRSCGKAALQSRVEATAVHYGRRLIRRVLDDMQDVLACPGGPGNTGERP